jgi:hypothetical protein
VVTGPGRRALLFLDADGPLLPFGTTAPDFAAALDTWLRTATGAPLR